MRTRVCVCCSVVWALALYSLLNIMKRSSPAFSRKKSTPSPSLQKILSKHKAETISTTLFHKLQIYKKTYRCKT